jgi:hypothetical protein
MAWVSVKRKHRGNFMFICVDWMHLAQDRDEWWSSEHGNETSIPIKCEEFLD